MVGDRELTKPLEGSLSAVSMPHYIFAIKEHIILKYGFLSLFSWIPYFQPGLWIHFARFSWTRWPGL